MPPGLTSEIWWRSFLKFKINQNKVNFLNCCSCIFGFHTCIPGDMTNFSHSQWWCCWWWCWNGPGASTLNCRQVVRRKSSSGPRHGFEVLESALPQIHNTKYIRIWVAFLFLLCFVSVSTSAKPKKQWDHYFSTVQSLMIRNIVFTCIYMYLLKVLTNLFQEQKFIWAIDGCLGWNLAVKIDNINMKIP